MKQAKLMTFFTTPNSKSSSQKIMENENFASPKFLSEPETETKKSVGSQIIDSFQTPIPTFRAKTVNESMEDLIERQPISQKMVPKTPLLQPINEDESSEFEDKTPDWALPEFCRDKSGRKMGDEGYDPTTLFIPPEAFRKLTPTMKQYWEVKSDNFDKVIFFKLGKFYELFYEDAAIGKKHFDLNFMGKKMHAGFPEKALDKFAIKFVEKGYKVAVVEQTETPKEMTERLNGAKRGIGNVKAEKTIQRQMVEVMTKGTFHSNHEDFNANSQFLFAIRMERCFAKLDSHQQYDIGIVMLDSTVNRLVWCSFQDDAFFTKTKSVVAQMRPKELVFEPGNLDKVLLGVFSNSFIGAQLSPLSNSKSSWHSGIVQSLLGDDLRIPENERLVLEAFSGCLSYLKQCCIQEKVMSGLRIMKFDPSCKTKMIIDSQAMQHLEIFKSSLETGKDETKGSLFSFINYTVTPFGKRLLQRWLVSPLFDVEKIKDRYTAIEDLQSIPGARDQFRRELSKLPDLERKCARMYQNAVKATTKAVYFEDVQSKHLLEMKELFGQLRTAEKLVKRLSSESLNFKSKRLAQLTQQTDENLEEIEFEGNSRCSILPFISPYLDQIESLIQWEASGQDSLKPKPAQGLHSEFDNIRYKCLQIENQLEKLLEKEKASLQCPAMTFCHSVYRFQIEVPDSFVAGKKKPAHFEFMTKRNGFQRFYTPEIKELVDRLEDQEDEEKKVMSEFVSSVLVRFRENFKIWDNFLAVLAELDCLMSLSIASEGHTKPKVLSPQGKTSLRIVEGKHPTLAILHGNLIPNSVFMTEDHNRVIMLSGPNMGGKSTLLRMVCNLVILAQMGCFVPAEEMEFSLIDQIFTRLGASDMLLENKSTFYIEMEETLKVLRDGTRNSLAIMDELGRGTSTFDGVAIAYGTIRHIASKIQCFCLFATHFHVLLEESRLYHEIGLGYMDAIIKEEEEKVVFLYRFKEGACHSSFGINVAKSAGLCSKILTRAKSKAEEFESRLQMTKKFQLDRKFNCALQELLSN